MSAVQFKFDASQLQESLKRLAVVSDKLPSEIVNQKGWRIFQKSVWGMKAVSKETIQSELGASAGHVLVRLKSGKYSRAKKNVRMFFGQGAGDDENLPLAVAILQSRAQRGSPSPWKGVDRATGAQRMTEALRKFYGARQKSRAFFKATFGVIRDTFKAVSVKSSGLAGASDGIPKAGSLLERKGKIADAVPARQGSSKAVSTFWLQSPKHDAKDAVDQYAGPVLQKAMDDEASSTAQHAAEKEYKDAIAALGIKVT